MMKLSEDKKTDKRFNRMQWRMLFATMIGYTLFYFMRKNFSFTMPGLQQDCGISKSMLGNFLFWGGIVYGLSKFLNGIIGDKVNPRKMLCFGLLACTLLNVAFGVAPEIAARLGTGEQGTGNGSVALAWTFGILLVVNQFFQGTGFPPCAKLIAFWIPPKELATKMSVWNTSHSIGGGLVAKICGVIMGLGAIGAANQGVGMWRWCFWSMAALGFLGLVLMLFWLPGTPKEEGLPDLSGTDVAREKRQECRFPEEKGQVGEATLLSLHDQPSMARMVFLNPVIWMLGVANFTINAVRALIADWGPTMLQEAKGFDPGSTGTVIMLFEFAGIAGMLFAGWATERRPTPRQSTSPARPSASFPSSPTLGRPSRARSAAILRSRLAAGGFRCSSWSRLPLSARLCFSVSGASAPTLMRLPAQAPKKVRKGEKCRCARRSTQEICHLYKRTLKLLYCPPRAGGRRQPSRGWWTSCTTS